MSKDYDALLQEVLESMRATSISRESVQKALGRTMRLSEGTFELTSDKSVGPARTRVRRNWAIITGSKRTRRVAIAAGLIILAVTAAFLPIMSRSPSAAFAQIVEQVLKARSMSYVEEISFGDGRKPLIVKTRIADNGRTRLEYPRYVDSRPRSEVKSQPRIEVKDEYGATRLLLLEDDKIAVEYPADPDLKLPGGESLTGWQNWKSIATQSHRQLEGKELQGRRVDGFAFGDGKGPLAPLAFTIWLDHASGQIVSMEIDLPGSQMVDGVSQHDVKRDFEFDPKLEESLFSYEAPPGYTVKKGIPGGPQRPMRRMIDH